MFKQMSLLALFLALLFGSPGVSSRHLLQTSGSFEYPGCTPLSSSVLATNPDFSEFYYMLQEPNDLFGFLSTLDSPATLFAFTNEADQDSVASFNHTVQQAETDPAIATYRLEGELYTVVTEFIPELSDFEDGQVLNTLLNDYNLTVHVDVSNGADVVTLESFGSISTIITPPQYACNLVIYGINADVVPPEFINFASTLYTYLEFVLKPGGAEVPAGLVLAAVEAGATSTVAAAFDEAVQLGYSQQLVAILRQAVTIPGGVAAIAEVANEMIVQTGCGTLQPLIHQLYPAIYSTPESLGLTLADLASLPAQNPRLANCARNGV